MQIQNVVQIRSLIELVFLAKLPDQFFCHPEIVISLLNQYQFIIDVKLYFENLPNTVPFLIEIIDLSFDVCLFWFLQFLHEKIVGF